MATSWATLPGSSAATVSLRHLKWPVAAKLLAIDGQASDSSTPSSVSEILWAGLLTTSYVAMVGLVLSACQALGLLHLELQYLPLIIPIAFVSACAFAALGLCFTALVPTIDHMNLPIFLVVLPLAFVSGTYFPLGHPVLASIATVNPLYHLAEGVRGLLLGAPATYHLALLSVLLIVMLIVLVPLDMRLLRKRVLGD